MRRRIVWVLVMLLLGLTGAVGVYNGISEWSDPHTPLQQSVTVAVFLYGIAGLAGTYALALRRRWSVWAAVAWGVCTTYAGTVATIAYGGSDASSGAGARGRSRVRPHRRSDDLGCACVDARRRSEGRPRLTDTELHHVLLSMPGSSDRRDARLKCGRSPDGRIAGAEANLAE